MNFTSDYFLCVCHNYFSVLKGTIDTLIHSDQIKQYSLSPNGSALTWQWSISISVYFMKTIWLSKGRKKKTIRNHQVRTTGNVSCSYSVHLPVRTDRSMHSGKLAVTWTSQTDEVRPRWGQHCFCFLAR